MRHSASSACVIDKVPSIASAGKGGRFFLYGDQNLVLVFRSCRIHPNVQCPSSRYRSASKYHVRFVDLSLRYSSSSSAASMYLCLMSFHCRCPAH
jgi:hypothetical protein